MNSISDIEKVKKRKANRIAAHAKAVLFNDWRFTEKDSNQELIFVIDAIVTALIEYDKYEPSKGEIDQLHAETGAGHMQCKRALIATEGDFEIAKRNL